MTNAEVTAHCKTYNERKIRFLWLHRENTETRCEIRRSLRMLKDIRDFNGTLQVY